MNKILLLTFLFSANNLTAMCNCEGINIWPTKDIVSLNSIFVIEGFSQSQETIRKLKFGSIYLKSKNHVVPLKIVKILEGQFSLTQAILKPTELLQHGQKYELIIDNLKFPDDDFKSKTYLAILPIDKEVPKWNCNPKYIGKTYTRFGCGPAKGVVFCTNYTDESPTLVYTKVYSKELKSNSDYYLKSENNSVGIGHGMCSGEFTFSDDSTYEVRFGLMDASGNEISDLSEPISYTKPTKEDSNNTFESNCDCSKTNLYLKLLFGFLFITLLLLIYKNKRNKDST